MLVKNWMSKNVITIEADESMDKAIKLMKTNRIRMLPVMQHRQLVGILTDRDLKKASASDATALEIHELMYLISTIKVKQIMTRDPITVRTDHTVEETAETLLKHKISGVPVCDADNRVVGVITQTDIFRVLVSLTGVGKRGIQFAFDIEDRPGSIKEVTDFFREFGGRMVSILTSYEQAPDGYRRVYVRMYGIEREKLGDLTTRLNQKARLLYMVDHTQNKRTIYQTD